MSCAAFARLALRDVPRALTGAILLIVIAINTANIVGRYVFAAPVAWAEEVMVFLLVWSVFLGASAVTYDKAHLTMDLFVDAFPPAVRKIIQWGTVAAIVCVCVFCLVQSMKIVALMYRMGQVSMTAQLPMVIPYSGFVVGFALIALAAIAGAFEERPRKAFIADVQL